MPHKDPEQRKAFYREWKKGSKKKLSNKYFDAAKHANARAERYGVEGRITTQDAREVLSEGVCFYCGAEGSGPRGRGASGHMLGLDHRIAMALGGPNARENLVPCCHSCNASKFRGERPHQWSRAHDACIECGTTDRKHDSHGRCVRCAGDYRRKAHAQAKTHT